MIKYNTGCTLIAVSGQNLPVVWLERDDAGPAAGSSQPRQRYNQAAPCEDLLMAVG